MSFTSSTYSFQRENAATYCCALKYPTALASRSRSSRAPSTNTSQLDQAANMPRFWMRATTFRATAFRCSCVWVYSIQQA